MSWGWGWLSTSPYNENHNSNKASNSNNEIITSVLDHVSHTIIVFLTVHIISIVFHHIIDLVIIDMIVRGLHSNQYPHAIDIPTQIISPSNQAPLRCALPPSSSAGRPDPHGTADPPRLLGGRPGPEGPGGPRPYYGGSSNPMRGSNPIRGILNSGFWAFPWSLFFRVPHLD